MSDERDQNGDGGQSSSGFALTVRRAANLSAETWTDERIAVVKRTVAPADAGAAEVAMFLAVAARYDLDPFLKEIWLVKDKGRLIILTGKDAILKEARRHRDYQGFEADCVYEQDTFEAVHEGGDIWVAHRISGFNRGSIVGAYCLARKAGSPAVLVMRRWDEFSHLHGKDNWKMYGPDMILSRVVTAAHRLLYNISGMYTQEEMETGEAQEELASHDVAQKTRERLLELKDKLTRPAPAPVIEEASFEIVQEEKPAASPPPPAPKAEAPTPAPQDDPPVSKAELKEDDERARARGRFWSLYAELGYDQDVVEQEEARKDWLDTHFGKRSIGQLSLKELRNAIGLLEIGSGPDKPAQATEAQAVSAGDMPV